MFEIRPLSFEQIPLIQALTQKVWPQTYRSIITEEQIAYMLEKMYSTESLKQQMNEGHRFLGIWQQAEPVGFASYGETNNSGCYKLHKLYIVEKKQRHGAGKALLNEVLHQIKIKGGTHLILQVNRKNERAIAFYVQNGFQVEETLDIEIGGGFYMNDYIMGRTP